MKPKPKRHIWEEGSTHRAVAGKEYDEAWDYIEYIEKNMYCHEDELPCELTAELYVNSVVDGVRLYPWKHVAMQLKYERDAGRLRKEIEGNER